MDTSPTPESRESEHRVVVNGTVQAQRLLPHVLAGADLLSRSDLLGAHVELAGFGMARFSIPWAEVTARPDQVSFELVDTRGYDLAIDLILSLPKIQTEIPAASQQREDGESQSGPPIEKINSIELVQSSDYVIPTELNAHAGLARLIDGSLFRSFLAPRGLSRLEYEIDGGDVDADLVRVRAEPSRSKDCWLFASCAVQWQAPTTPDDEAQLLDRVATHWPAAIDMVSHRLVSIIQDLEPVWAVSSGIEYAGGSDAD